MYEKLVEENQLNLLLENQSLYGDDYAPQYQLPDHEYNKHLPNFP